MTEIDYIKAKLDLTKFGLSGFLAGFFGIVYLIYTEDDSFTRILLLFPLIIIAIFIRILLYKYSEEMEKLN